MKISQLLISVLVLLLSGAAIMYSADQQKVMEAVTTTHGAGQQVDASSATGLRKLNQELDAERGTVASERAEAVKAVEATRVEMRDSAIKRDEMQSTLKRHKEELKGVRAEVKAMKSTVAKLSKEYRAELEKLKIPGKVEVPDSEDFTAVVDAIKAVVDGESKRKEETGAQLAEVQTLRTAKTEELAKEKVELARLTAINEKFFTDYTKNDDEYPLLAVDARWKFVVFNAGKESGLVPGDATPVLVKRGGVVITPVRIIAVSNGMVVAEYDPKKLMPGVRPELGDRAFRVKPLGN